MKFVSFYLITFSSIVSLIAASDIAETTVEKDKPITEVHSLLKSIETKDADPVAPTPASQIPFISSETKTSFFSQVIILGIIAVGAVILAVRFKQKGFGAFKLRKNEGKLKISEIKDLGNRQFLVVVEYEAQKILLGVTPGNISNLGHLISPFNDPDFLNENETAKQQSDTLT